MFQEIYRFELKYNLKRIAPYVFFAVLGLMAYMDASNVSPTRTMINTHGQIDHNSPITIARTFLFLSILGSIIPIVFAGTSVVRDFEKNVHEFFFSKPVSKLGFLTGRFFGGFTVVIFIFLGVVLGIAVGCLQIDSQYVGAFRLEGFLQPFLMFAVPNLLLMAVVFFAFATLTRNMIATYIAGIASIVIYLFAQSTLGDTENQALRSLLDPFGFVALEVTTEFWTVAERNTQLLPFKGFILWNRLLWLAVTVGIFVFLYFKFRFVYQKEGRCTKQATEATDIEFKGIRRLEKLPSVARTFAWKNHVKQLVRLVKLECLRIVPHPAFLFLTFLGMMQAYGNFVENAGPNGSNVYPLTSWYLNWTSELFGYMIPITVFFAGVVVWREGDSRSEEIFDAMPVPDWVLFLSKLLTMMAIQTVFILAVMATGIFAQGVIFGYTKFELPLYFKALFGIQLLNYWHMAIVAILIQALVSHKYVGYFLSGGYFIADYVVYSTFNVTNFLHRFGLVPDYVYSNMNGFGHYAEPIIWYRIYWAFAAVILIVVSDLLWRRGQETKLKFRLRAGKQRLSRKHVLIAAVAACAFVSTGSFIYYNIHVLNPYLTQEDRLQNRANYEKRYGKYAHIAQPSIDHISFDVDIFPQKRDALIKGSYLLKNAGDTAIDSLHVRLSPLRISRMNQLALEHPAQLVHGDEQLGYYIFELAHPLTPGDSARLAFDLEARTKGFTDITPNDELVENGTYLDNFPFSEPYYFPAVGYSIFYEIRDPSLRAEYGLPKKQIPPPLEDSVARNQAAADWVTFEAVVSTSDDQIAVATGDLVESWSENGRNYYRYMVDKLMNNALVFLSGRYEVERDKHKDVDIEVFYHKEHHYNIERMIQGVRASLDYCSHNFASYPYNTVKIVEVPDYGIIGGSARSQPTVFTWTENGGFISNLEDEDAIDVV
ncbi:hypothetical protein GWO43_18645, partial [candidate division KSB1 bacterium]|nr:hypothetical protein [candidate division KSB1 bacterium]NIR70679.1 hypothetical protein [candidate division KSB1 bacterium]NIS26031.1 hypothetical protein [candidate division KSB1 bacterium]NIT72855.1 hypothetical protein [candidate division KSB1 bacterium]NIU26696.1 hypothetical protein [candidate division KSB1 bacterium]